MPIQSSSPLAGRMLSVLRIAAALLFLAHGTSKLFHFPSNPPGTPPMNFAVLYCFVWLYFAFAGGGEWSLDAMRTARARDQ